MKKLIMKVLSVGTLFLLTACGSGFDVVINKNVVTEYGENFDSSKVFDKDKSDKGVSIKDVKGFNARQIGEQEITVTFALGDDTQEEKIKINVKDTRAPEITLKSETVEITLGDEIDTTSNIESVKDPVDGDINLSTDHTIVKNGYYTSADIKSEVGKYTVTVTAFDKNGNKAEKTYEIVIKEKPQEASAVYSSQQTPDQSQQSYQGAQAQDNSAVSSGGGNSSTSQPEVSEPIISEPVPVQVYIAGSGNGTRYHSNPYCSNMNEPIAISKEEAISQGYTPCKKCY